MPAFSLPATEFLSVTEQPALIAAAQDVPVEVVLVDGEEVTRYGKTPASERAMERLIAAFMPVIEKEARRAKVNDEDDALGVLLAEFVSTVHLHDATSPIPFSSTIGTILRRKMSDTDRVSDVVVVKESVAAVYWRLMHKHDFDFAAAYAEVKATANNLAPATFLSVHNIIGGIDSLDPIRVAEDSENGARHALANAVGSHEERIVTAAEVDYLFSKVTDEEATIVRLAYGFRDFATEKIRVEAGFKGGEILTDVEISGTSVPLGRATINRRRLSALSKMREAMEESLLEAL